MLKNEIALVTGGSRGIGKAIALELAEKGAFVVVNYTSNEEEAKKVVAEIERKGNKAIAKKADISSYTVAENLVRDIEKNIGVVTILVNNAGITRDTLLMRMKEDDWDRVIDVNLKGAFNCAKACIKGMIKGKKGNIINVSSVVGLSGNAGQSNYAASKAGLVGFTKSLAKEVGSRGIRVNCVAPGFIQTEMTSKLPDDMVEKIKENISLGGLGSPEDIAQLVSFLVSPAAAYITGEVIKVDGGLNL